MAKCDRIVKQEVSSFMRWLDSLQATPIIRKLHQHFESVRAEELEKVVSRIPDLSDKAQEKLDTMTRRMIKRLLHVPTTRIKKVARQKDSALGLGLISDLLGLYEDGRGEK